MNSSKNPDEEVRMERTIEFSDINILIGGYRHINMNAVFLWRQAHYSERPHKDIAVSGLEESLKSQSCTVLPYDYVKKITVNERDVWDPAARKNYLGFGNVKIYLEIPEDITEYA